MVWRSTPGLCGVPSRSPKAKTCF